MLTTRQKLFLVRLAFGPVRLLTGNREPDKWCVQRHRIEWELDLYEAIYFVVFLLGAFKAGTIRAYRQVVRAGSIVLDIGASVGVRTLPLAPLVGSQDRVADFEPTKFAFSKLQANAALNPSLATYISAEHVLLSDAAIEHSLIETALSGRRRPSTEAHVLHHGEGKATAGTRSPNGPALTISIKALLTSVPVGANINLWACAK